METMSSTTMMIEDTENAVEGLHADDGMTISDEPKHSKDGKEANMADVLTDKSSMAATQDMPQQFVLLCKTKGKIKDCPVENFRCDSLSTVESGMTVYKLHWNGCDDQLANILTWFSNEVKPQDRRAAVEFPCELASEKERDIHELSDVLALGAISRGVREQRFMTVFVNPQEAKQSLKAKRPLKEEVKRFSQWMQQKNIAMPGEPEYSRTELTEMMKCKVMVPEIQDLYDTFKRGKTRGREVSQAEIKEKRDFDAIRWLKPEDGAMGHFFFNKLFVDGEADKYLDYQDLGITEILTFDDLVPTEDLHAILITNDDWLSDSLYISKYFPKSVNVTMVCPSHKATGKMVRRILVECPVHRCDFANLDSDMELVNVECGCPQIRYIKVVHPRSGDKMSAKLILSRYSKYVRIVIGSASFDQDSWESIGQFGWYCDLPIDQGNGGEMLRSNPDSFGHTLKSFLHSISQDLLVLLQGVNFSSLSPTVQLVTSVPNHVQDRHGDYGMTKLNMHVAGIKWPKDSQPVFVYQTPDLCYERRIWSFLYMLNASLGTDVFTKSLDRDKPWDWLDKVNPAYIKLVFPCVSSMTEAESKFQFPKGLRYVNYEDSMFQVRPYMVDNTDPIFGKIVWNSRVASRLCDVKDTNAEKGIRRYGWLLVGSHGLSYRAWGESLPRRNALKVYNYELAVLHVPHKFCKGKGLQWLAPDFSHVTLPYNEHRLMTYPLSAYPMSLLRALPMAEDEKVYHFIAEIYADFNNYYVARTHSQPTNEEEAQFFRKQELLTRCEEIGNYTNIHIMKDELKKVYPNGDCMPGMGSLLAVLACKKKHYWRVYWILNSCQVRSDQQCASNQEVDKWNMSAHLVDSITSSCDAVKKKTYDGARSETQDAKDVYGDWQQVEKEKIVYIPKVKYTGMMVIGMDTNPCSPNFQSEGPMQIIKPESRGAYVNNLLSNVYNISLSKKTSLRGPTSIQYKKTVLACAKRRFLKT
ncbi:uncharacterized protein LOC144442701 [Glandiceps talaboti]